MKRIFIVHRWGGSPTADWYPWIKSELEKRGFQVFVPIMPNPATPKIKSWVETLRKAVKKPDKETFFIGHSIGCQTIIRYLETLSANTKVGGAVFIAGWFELYSEATPSEKEQAIAKPWLENSIDFKKAHARMNKAIAILSDDDPYVPLIENRCDFEGLGAKVIVEHNKGHYDEDSKTFKLPIALKALLEIAK